jgi:uncharacterized protein GlcG (DUF336 family)
MLRHLSLLPLGAVECADIRVPKRVAKEITLLTLVQATHIVDEALAYGRRHQFAPLTVAVLDMRGCVVALKMEDGSSLLRPEIAVGKAWSALGMGVGTRSLAARAQKVPSFFTALAVLAEGRLVPVPGGVLIRSEAGEILGAVGASGDNSDNDEASIVAGIEAAGLRADPGVPDGA